MRDIRAEYNADSGKFKEMIAEMLVEDYDEWMALTAVLDAHPGESLHGSDLPRWTSRDVYTHLSCWIAHSTLAIKALLAGENPSVLKGSDDEVNARWQQEYSRLTLTEAHRRADTAFEQRRLIIESIPAGRWNSEVEKFARFDGAAHFRLHRSYITVANS